MSSNNVQFGCGLRAGSSWLNYDASPTLRLAKVPFLKRLLRLPDWPEEVMFGNIVKGLPLPDACCARLYCDQVLEHLCRDDVALAIKECRRLLGPDGVFRMFLPDLRAIAAHYVAQGQGADAGWFMATTGLGLQRRPRGAMDYVRELAGNSRHLWAWDVDSLGQLLRSSGFTHVRQVAYRDSGDEVFDELEGPIEWQFAFGMEARAS